MDRVQSHIMEHTLIPAMATCICSNLELAVFLNTVVLPNSTRMCEYYYVLKEVLKRIGSSAHHLYLLTSTQHNPLPSQQLLLLCWQAHQHQEVEEHEQSLQSKSGSPVCTCHLVAVSSNKEQQQQHQTCDPN